MKFEFELVIYILYNLNLQYEFVMMCLSFYIIVSKNVKLFMNIIISMPILFDGRF